MKALITGITGMIGSHVAAGCRERGMETYGIARNSASSRLNTHSDPFVRGVDVLDRDNLETTFSEIRPDLVVHLAAQAYNGISWDCEEITHLTNYQGTINVLKTCKKIVPDAKILLACSSAEYGHFEEHETPLKENRPLRPITPYGVTKVATESLGFQYFHNYGMKIFLPRLFIHVGTGHPPATAIQNFARQLALIASKKAEPVMQVGNLSSARDFVDVRDGVEAMFLLLEKGNPGEPYNICNGHAYSIREVLDMLIDISGLDVEIRQDPNLLRVSDEPLLIGDNSKMKSMGWKPVYTLRQTLISVYEDWQKRVR